MYRSEDGRRVFIIGEVHEFLPPKRFVHTFRFTNLPETPTLVEWTLEEKSGVTRVTVCLYTHLRAHETVLDLVCRLLLEKKNTTKYHSRTCTTSSS